MARIRSVHPGLFTDEAFVQLDAQAQILLIGLWTQADDNGVFEWKPRTLKMRLLPATRVDVEAVLAKLERGDFIRRIEVGGRGFGLVRNFGRYQKPKKPSYVHPLPPEARDYVVSRAPISPPVENPDGGEGEFDPPREGRGEEGSEAEGNASARQGLPEAGEDCEHHPPCRLPADFVVVAAMRALAAREAPLVDLERETAQFRDYWRAKPGAAGLSSNWTAVWRRWMRRAQDDLARAASGAASRAAARAVAGGARAWPAGGETPWARRVREFAASGFWIENWGAPPGQPGCVAPVSVLVTHGFAAMGAGGEGRGEKAADGKTGGAAEEAAAKAEAGAAAAGMGDGAEAGAGEAA